MDNIENYYEVQKQVLALKEKLRYLKNQEKMKNLNERLNVLHKINNELTDTVTNFNENCKFVSENVEKVGPLLKTNSKINMNQECAERFKSIVGTVPLLMNSADTIQDLQLNNLNIDTEELIEGSSNRMYKAKMNLHYSSTLHRNVNKLVNPEAITKDSSENAYPLTVVTTTDNKNILHSDDLMNCTSESAITFSGAVSSSPLNK